MDYEKAPPENCPQAVFDAVLDTPEPDKWIDCGEVRPLPMFHMHTLMKYGEKCAFTTVTHGVKMEWQPIETAPRDGTTILVYFKRHGAMSVSWTSREDDGFYIWCVDDHKFGPYAVRGYMHGDDTHWMPLPPPPGEQA